MPAGALTESRFPWVLWVIPWVACVSLCILGADDQAKRPADASQADKLKDLIAGYGRAQGKDKWLAMQRISSLGTPDAIGYLCELCEDRAQPINERSNAMLLLAERIPLEPDRVEATFLRLLDDPQPVVAEEAAAKLTQRSLSKKAIAALVDHWPVNRPPAWAAMASVRLIRQLDDPAVSAAFLNRIESPKLHLVWRGLDLDLGAWDEVPRTYRTRLLGFMSGRPLDPRGLVHAAAMSAAKAANPQALDFLCDRLVSANTPCFGAGWDELQIIQALVRRDPKLAPPETEAALARKLAGETTPCLVLKNQDRWFVLLDEGHPGADGRFRITIIDAKSQKVIKAVGTDGGLRSLQPGPAGR